MMIETKIKFNKLLVGYARKNGDITIAFHHNIRDPSMSLFYNPKHISDKKIAKYAANMALKGNYLIIRSTHHPSTLNIHLH